MLKIKPYLYSSKDLNLGRNLSIYPLFALPTPIDIEICTCLAFSQIVIILGLFLEQLVFSLLLYCYIKLKLAKLILKY